MLTASATSPHTARAGRFPIRPVSRRSRACSTSLPLKVLFRHEEHTADALLAGAREIVAHQVELSHSNSADGLLEISAAGVDKGSGLARLCATLGAGPDDVIAFGDMPNDLSLLGWAGRAVAVANAHASVREAADELAPANDDDGVAVVIEAAA